MLSPVADVAPLSLYARALLTSLWPPQSLPDGTLRPLEVTLRGVRVSAAHPEDFQHGLPRHHLILRSAALQRLGLNFFMQGRFWLTSHGNARGWSLYEYDRQPETVAHHTDLMARLAAQPSLAPLWNELRDQQAAGAPMSVQTPCAELSEAACRLLQRRHSLGAGRHSVVFHTAPEPTYTVHREADAASPPLPLNHALVSAPGSAPGELSHTHYLAGGEALQRKVTAHYFREMQATPDVLLRELREWSHVPGTDDLPRTLILPVRV